MISNNVNSVDRWTAAQGIFIPDCEVGNWRPLRDADRYNHVLFGQVKSGITDGILGFIETVNPFKGGSVFHISIGQMDKATAPLAPEDEEEIA